MDMHMPFSSPLIKTLAVQFTAMLAVQHLFQMYLCCLAQDEPEGLIKSICAYSSFFFVDGKFSICLYMKKCILNLSLYLFDVKSKITVRIYFFWEEF